MSDVPLPAYRPAPIASCPYCNGDHFGSTRPATLDELETAKP